MTTNASEEKQAARWHYYGPHSREVCDNAGRAVCKVAASAPDNTGKLLAAAPDLLAALEEITTTFTQGGWVAERWMQAQRGEAIKCAERAIRSARGE